MPHLKIKGSEGKASYIPARGVIWRWDSFCRRVFAVHDLEISYTCHCDMLSQAWLPYCNGLHISYLTGCGLWFILERCPYQQHDYRWMINRKRRGGACEMYQSGQMISQQSNTVTPACESSRLHKLVQWLPERLTSLHKVSPHQFALICSKEVLLPATSLKRPRMDTKRLIYNRINNELDATITIY